jgi:hypothetical protein
MLEVLQALLHLEQLALDQYLQLKQQILQELVNFSLNCSCLSQKLKPRAGSNSGCSQTEIAAIALRLTTPVAVSAEPAVAPEVVIVALSVPAVKSSFVSQVLAAVFSVVLAVAEASSVSRALAVATKLA